MEKLDIIQHLKIEKDKFLDEKHLDWYVLTFIRNYPEFLEDDYNNAMTLAKQHIDDYEQLTQYIVDLNNAYLSAKSDEVFICSGHTTLTQILLSV